MQEPSNHPPDNLDDVNTVNAQVIEGSDIEQEQSSMPSSWGRPAAGNTALSYYTTSNNWSGSSSLAGSLASSYGSTGAFYANNDSIPVVPPSAHNQFVPQVPSTVASSLNSQSSIPYNMMAPGSYTGSIPGSLPGSIPGSVPGSIPGSIPGFTPFNTASESQINNSNHGILGVNDSTTPITHPESNIAQYGSSGSMNRGLSYSEASASPFSSQYVPERRFEESNLRSSYNKATPRQNDPLNGIMTGTPDTPNSAKSGFQGQRTDYQNMSTSIPRGHHTSSGSFMAPSQIERSRNYSHWNSSLQPNFAANNSLASQPQQPQRSQLSSLLAQTRKGPTATTTTASAANNLSMQTPVNSVSSSNQVGIQGNSVGSNPNSLIATPRYSNPQIYPPEEPTLQARKSVDYPWAHENTASPPRSIARNLNVDDRVFPPNIVRGLQRPLRIRTFHFAGCDTNKVIQMIAAILRKIISHNDKAPEQASKTPLGPEGERYRGRLMSFHGCNVPGISLDAYLKRILKYCPSTAEVFIALVVYLDRLTEGGIRNSAEKPKSLFLLDSYNVHRLIIAGMTVASKFFSDVFYKNSRYAKVGGLGVEELNNLELQLLLIMDFRLMITVDELQEYADFLLNYDDVYLSSSS